ncbi:MAG: hypothetical protein ACRDFC_05550 [Ignavibacteria bacterium]
MKKNLIGRSLIILILPGIFVQCSKESKQTQGTENQNKEELKKQEIKTGKDEKADELIKEADESDAKFQNTKSEEDKKLCIKKQITAANYLMFESSLSPKQKYRAALRRYRRILELDPDNKEAAANKKQIEDIYQSMGMPVPE